MAFLENINFDFPGSSCLFFLDVENILKKWNQKLKKEKVCSKPGRKAIETRADLGIKSLVP